MNNGRWTRQQVEYLLEHMNVTPVRVIAEHLGKTPRAVKLYMFRNRISPPSQGKNLIQELLSLKFVRPEYFAPNKDFYRLTGISQMRWWRLYRGRAMPTKKEYYTLVKHFNVTLEEALELRQLDLFNDQEK